jgi:hypothetical protein
MVYRTQDYWVFGLCQPYGILKTQKNTTFLSNGQNRQKQIRF